MFTEGRNGIAGPPKSDKQNMGDLIKKLYELKEKNRGKKSSKKNPERRIVEQVSF